jgi:hypothetical protein
MKLSLEILNQYVEEGWVVRNDHPSLPLSIYNYSRKTQYEGKWDDVGELSPTMQQVKYWLDLSRSFSIMRN